VSHEPIAYTFEADHHCPDCTEERFGSDDAGFIACEPGGSPMRDSYGEFVGAVAPWDEWQQFSGEHETLACATCGLIIEEYEPYEG